MSTYRITVKTGNIVRGGRRLAGTNASVYITIYGETASGQPVSSDEMQIDNSRNNFEPGQIDVFSLDLADLGDLRKVRIRHDDSGEQPGWFLEYIKIRNEDSDTEWSFPCHRWLSKADDDGRTDRMLDRA